ncbi:MAG: sigma factor-like helix-turn-helix DNA-binding protein [Ilumatobacteraceae bacterium]
MTSRSACDLFSSFVAECEPRLRIALVAAYGADLGRIATFDALSWAWEHWELVETMENPVGYLYRVGQTSARRHGTRPIPTPDDRPATVELPDVHPELVPALASLTEQQRTAVMLVHAFGWTVRDAAHTLGIAPSTIQTHLERGLARLRHLLEVDDT